MAKDVPSMENKTAGRDKFVETGTDSTLRKFHRKNCDLKRY